ncbi:MAG: thiol-activated cytolysin family protein [Porphyromonadaceae bacterium]|nr:thiol-activated cytolysin family protein [Porphyromonadaceae bacterium]
MKITKISKGFVLSLGVLAGFIATSCGSKQDEPKKGGGDLQGQTNQTNTEFAQKFNSYVYSLPSVEQVKPFGERPFVQAAGLRATDALSKEYEQAKEVDEQLLFSDATSIFYPGALVKGSSVVDGSYIPIIAARQPITISTSLSSSTGKTSITVADPKLSTVRDAVSELLAREHNTPPADITYSSEEVHDEQHLKIALGANYNGTSVTVKASAGFNYDTERKRYLVKVQQVFYTLDIDPPAQPSDFFVNDFDYQRAFEGKKPVYVSTVKMGRVLLLGIETDMTKVELDAKLQVAFGGAFDANAELAYSSIKKNSSIRGRIIGGDAQLAGQSVADVSTISKFLTEGARYSRDNQGAPIAYQLRELGTNELFKTVIYSKYKKTESKPETITFDMYFNPSSLVSKSGSVQDRIGRTFIVRKSLNGNTSEDELRFDKNLAHRHIIDYKAGEELVLRVERDEERFSFRFPVANTLIREAKLKAEGKNLYDNADNNPLILEDDNQQYQFKIEIEKQRVSSQQQ